MNNEMIKKFEDAGFKRWTKGSLDRLYINPENLCLHVEKYKSGNISYAEFNGEKISNSFARDFLAVRIYVDVNDGHLHFVASGNVPSALKSAAVSLCESLKS